jgi:hypothetical protein
MNMRENKPEMSPETSFTSDQRLFAQEKALELELGNLKERYFAHRLSNREYYRQFEDLSLHLIDIQRRLRDLHFRSN